MSSLFDSILHRFCRASESAGDDGGPCEDEPQNGYLHRRPLLWPSIAALFASNLPVFWNTWVLLGLLGLGCLICLTAHVQNKSLIFKSVLILAACVLGLSRSASWHDRLGTAEALASSGKSFDLEILVLEAPKFTDFGATFPGLCLDLESENADFAASKGERFLIRTNPANTHEISPVEPGDILCLRGSPKLPDYAKNPGQFDYRAYLLSKRIIALYDVRSIEKCGGDSSFALKIRAKTLKSAGRFKKALDNCLDRCLPPDDAGIMKALLTMGSGDLDESTGEDFRKAGLSRFLNLTGFHVDAVMFVTYWLFKKVTGAYKAPRVAAIIFGTFLAWGSGFSAGAIRALVSSGMKLTAPLFCRKYDPIAALCFSGLIVAWRIPFPIFDMGFQMSFASALGAWVGRRCFSSAIFGVFLTVAPLVTYYFQDMSMASFVLGWLWASVTLSVTLLTLIVVAIPGGIAVLGWLPYMCAEGVRALASLVSCIPGASVRAGAFSGGEMVFWYAFVGLWAWGRSSRKSVSPFLRGVLLGTLTAFSVCAFLRLYPIWPEVTFLSVGQGDSAVIRYKNVCMVVDTGTESQFERVVLPFLSFKGVKTVDLCVLSHMHSDHAGGIGMLCRGFCVKAIVTAPKTVASLSDGIGPEAPAIVEANENVSWKIRDMVLQVAPLERYNGSYTEDENVRCIACFLTFGEMVFEFWADAPGSIIDPYLKDSGMAQNFMYQTRVVKVPHHGSPDGLLENLYQGTANLTAVISVGPNSYGHPSQEVLTLLESSGATVHCTDVTGAVTVGVMGKHLKTNRYITDRKFVR